MPEETASLRGGLTWGTTFDPYRKAGEEPKPVEVCGKQIMLFGGDGPPAPPANRAKAPLARRFIVPPFTVLDARAGYWQERKKEWLDLGIKSELGRGDCTPGGGGANSVRRQPASRCGFGTGGGNFDKCGAVVQPGGGMTKGLLALRQAQKDESANG